MRKIRLFTLLCVLMVVFGSLSFASAESRSAMHLNGADTGKTIGEEGQYFLLKNGKSVTFYVLPQGTSWLYPKDDALGWYYEDIVFDCEGPVKAKCNAGWVHIKKTRKAFVLSYDDNPSVKYRTAVITVIGMGYKAKFRLVQFGSSSFEKIVRKNDTVTVKYKIPSNKVSYACLYINASKDYDGESTLNRNWEIELIPGKTSVSFKVKEGWDYGVQLGTRYEISERRWVQTGGDYETIHVQYVTTTETIYPWQVIDQNGLEDLPL